MNPQINPSTAADREQGTDFLPKFDDRGFVTAVVIDSDSRDVLMVAFMNEEALDRTLQTRRATFWSRSRQTLWTKGESSGNFLMVEDILVDCDQDALVVIANPKGPTCHTGATSCFYRKVEGSLLSDAVLVKVKS